MKKSKKQRIQHLVGGYLKFLFFFRPKRALQKAYNLFCTPRKGKIQPEQEDFLDQADDEVVVVDDIELQTYRWSNTGEVVLLVHGWESNSYRWRFLIKKLQKEGYSVIAFDAPAHGYSTGKILNIPVYTKCLRKIINLYRPNHIIGHSVGAMSMIYHQYMHPNKELVKLVALAPPGELTKIMRNYKKTLNLSNKFMKALDYFFQDKHGFRFKEFSMASFVKEIDQKGLLIHDKYDEIVSYDEALKIKDNWKDIRFETTEKLGHSLIDDKVDNMIIDFLKDK